MSDKELPLLLDFYKCYRAVVRGKVEGLLLDQAGVSRVQKAGARRRAQRYFRLAESYAAKRPARPSATLVMGLSGSGKSVLAGAIAARTGAVLLSTDMLRRELAGVEPASSAESVAVDADRYAPEARFKVYEEMARQASAYLEAGRSVVLDGTFNEREQRAPVLNIVERLAVMLLLVECRAPEAVIEERQRQRAGEAWSTSEGRWDVYLAQKQRYEPPDEVPPQRRLVVDTTRPLAEQIEAVTGVVASRRRPQRRVS